MELIKFILLRQQTICDLVVTWPLVWCKAVSISSQEKNSEHNRIDYENRSHVRSHSRPNENCMTFKWFIR